ncbi:MAG: type I-C CRISPR-associated endonuclease Cas1c [Christensenellaceae bacterium]|nr:type I-C CRISPR-associated endonuclease Cas1c [Christensenellaceae bacterium]MEA5065847.1 type I-C CRISPR-associated endonuclease Cas1c [Eubacteriales bacterium]MEA5068946.1 type I-C CRISPR-associated endonuclease Cas1c [Christensenellaceae bacterium]
MKRLNNTLYVTSPDAYLSLDGENVVVLKGDKTLGRVPMINLQGVVSFGYRGVSPALMGACAEKGIDLCFLTPHGRFLSRVVGPVHGNVLLRKAQQAWAVDPARAHPVARMFLTGKIYNARWCLERVLRDHGVRVDRAAITSAIDEMKGVLSTLGAADSIDALMGLEGIAAKAYFGAFNEMILRDEVAFQFDGRNRRPPMDRVNALLSFAYALLGNEVASALESVGLDPYVGFLHQLRPGRASLAQDLLEELRAPVADRFVLTQINLGAVAADDFQRKENGAYYLRDDARKRFLAAWQVRKQEGLTHPFLKEKLPWGLVPYAQAMLLARHLRGDLDAYPPFLWK